jgi:hypothetical protein
MSSPRPFSILDRLEAVLGFVIFEQIAWDDRLEVAMGYVNYRQIGVDMEIVRGDFLQKIRGDHHSLGMIHISYCMSEARSWGSSTSMGELVWFGAAGLSRLAFVAGQGMELPLGSDPGPGFTFGGNSLGLSQSYV